MFDRHLAGDARPLLSQGERENTEKTVDIFQGVSPVPNYLHLLSELIAPQGQMSLPMEKTQWPQIRKNTITQLRRCVPGILVAGIGDGSFACKGQWLFGEGLDVKAYRGCLDGQDMYLHLIMPAERRSKVIISVVNKGQNVTHGIGRIAQGVDKSQACYGGFELRFAGNNVPASDKPVFPPGSSLMSSGVTLSRYMDLVGLTPVLMTIMDILAFVEFLSNDVDFKGSKIYFHGKGDAGVAALYAGVFDERIAGVLLENVPSSHRHSSPVLGVLLAFDMPQAVGLMAPRKTALINQGHSFRNWPKRA